MIHFDANFLVAALAENTDAAARLDGWVEKGERLAVSTTPKQRLNFSTPLAGVPAVCGIA